MTQPATAVATESDDSRIEKAEPPTDLESWRLEETGWQPAERSQKP